jgi:hypothetical protein
MIGRIADILVTPAAIALSLSVDVVVLGARILAPVADAGAVLLAETADTARWITAAGGTTP